jgi:spore coat polysaccharide biosynthesis protein SpsF
MNTVMIVQARMTSTRLPGKVLKSVLGKPLLEYQIERLKRVRSIDELVIATTINAADDPIIALCHQLGVHSYRGSENDVLSRFYGASQEYAADLVVRITSDCPLIDPQVIEQVVNFYKVHQADYDYVSNSLRRTYPRGMDTEVFSMLALSQAFVEATTTSEREHVTPFIYCQPERYRLGYVYYYKDYSYHRWTVDTPEDFELIQRIVEALYPQQPQFTLEACLHLLNQNPDWVQLNSHIEQKHSSIS